MTWVKRAVHFGTASRWSNNAPQLGLKMTAIGRVLLGLRKGRQAVVCRCGTPQVAEVKAKTLQAGPSGCWQLAVPQHSLCWGCSFQTEIRPLWLRCLPVRVYANAKRTRRGLHSNHADAGNLSKGQRNRGHATHGGYQRRPSRPPSI